MNENHKYAHTRERERERERERRERERERERESVITFIRNELNVVIFSIICGLSQFTTKEHIARAALEAVCFQTREVRKLYTSITIRANITHISIER